jgi:hypothetical protein
LRHRDVLLIAVPIIISNVTTPLIGFVDTAVIGRLGVAHLIGGVAIGAVLFNMLYWGFGFLRMGTTGLTAQAVMNTLVLPHRMPWVLAWGFGEASRLFETLDGEISIVW